MTIEERKQRIADKIAEMQENEEDMTDALSILGVEIDE